jgi:hypothetical protein
MRTTILLPDELYDEVRAAAAAEQRTVTSVIEEALRAALRDRNRPRSHPPLRLEPVTGSGLQVDVDLDDSAGLASLMDGLDARP